MRIQIESRLIDFVNGIDVLCKSIDNSYLSQHLKNQILRSSSSAALNYGESLAAESRKDFIHKTSIVLKELRETKISLKLLRSKIKAAAIEKHKVSYKECDELIAIFYKSLKTLKENK